MLKIKMLKYYWIDGIPTPAYAPEYLDYIPTYYSLLLNAKAEFIIHHIQNTEISAFSITLYNISDAQDDSSELTSPISTLLYMQSGKAMVCLKRTTEDMPPFDPN